MIDANMDQQGNRPGRKLLVVDDDVVQRSIIARMAIQAGFETSVAASLDEAEGRIGSSRYDCITLDLALGDQSGTRLLESIAARGTGSVIVISGCDQRILNTATQLARTVGMKAHQLPKPLDLSELRRMLSICMSETSPAPRGVEVAASIGNEAVADAVRLRQIVPWFQPKVDLSTGRIVGCEALARWPHPELGMIPPDVFIPIIERTGLMPELTENLLAQSTMALRRIVDSAPGFAVAVNISASLLAEQSIADYVDRALSASNLPATALVLEVTESVAMRDVARAADILVGLRVKGVGLSIDDFGTGYSSLAALARMPFNELKIDGQLVRESGTNPDMMRVARAIVMLGHELGMKVVAEGIETPHTLARLRNAGCDIGQGLVFLPAVEAARLADYLRRFAGGAGLHFQNGETLSQAG